MQQEELAGDWGGSYTMGNGAGCCEIPDKCQTDVEPMSMCRGQVSWAGKHHDCGWDLDVRSDFGWGRVAGNVGTGSVNDRFAENLFAIRLVMAR